MIYMPVQASIPRPRLRGMPSVLQDASFAAPLAFYALRGVDVVVVPSSAAQQHNLSAAASAR